MSRSSSRSCSATARRRRPSSCSTCTSRAGRSSPTAPARSASSTSSGSTSTACGRRCRRTTEGAVPDPDDESEEYDPRLVASFMRQRSRPARWFLPGADGRFDVLLPEAGRMLVGRMAQDLRDLLLTPDEALRRLYPTAYPDDAERNAEFTAFAHDQLLMARLEGLDLVEGSVDNDELSTEELTAWMQVINEARLVLGTRLDVSEDDERDDDPDDPDAPAFTLYHQLGLILEDMVRALHDALPPPTEPDEA